MQMQRTAPERSPWEEVTGKKVRVPFYRPHHADTPVDAQPAAPQPSRKRGRSPDDDGEDGRLVSNQPAIHHLAYCHRRHRLYEMGTMKTNSYLHPSSYRHTLVLLFLRHSVIAGDARVGIIYQCSLIRCWKVYIHGPVLPRAAKQHPPGFSLILNIARVHIISNMLMDPNRNLVPGSQSYYTIWQVLDNIIFPPSFVGLAHKTFCITL